MFYIIWCKLCICSPFLQNLIHSFWDRGRLLQVFCMYFLSLFWFLFCLIFIQLFSLYLPICVFFFFPSLSEALRLFFPQTLWLSYPYHSSMVDNLSFKSVKYLCVWIACAMRLYGYLSHQPTIPNWFSTLNKQTDINKRNSCSFFMWMGKSVYC